jgi:hypothetical protein
MKALPTKIDLRDALGEISKGKGELSDTPIRKVDYLFRSLALNY